MWPIVLELRCSTSHTRAPGPTAPPAARDNNVMVERERERERKAISPEPIIFHALLSPQMRRALGQTGDTGPEGGRGCPCSSVPSLQDVWHGRGGQPTAAVATSTNATKIVHDQGGSAPVWWRGVRLSSCGILVLSYRHLESLRFTLSTCFQHVLFQYIEEYSNGKPSPLSLSLAR